MWIFSILDWQYTGLMGDLHYGTDSILDWWEICTMEPEERTVSLQSLIWATWEKTKPFACPQRFSPYTTLARQSHILHWQGKGLAPSQRWVRQQLPEHFAFWSPGPPDILLPTTVLLQLDALKVTCIYSSFYRAQHQFVSVVIHVQLLSKCSLGGATTFLWDP